MSVAVTSVYSMLYSKKAGVATKKKNSTLWCESRSAAKQLTDVGNSETDKFTPATITL
jgi:hypothetical protein